MLPSGKLQGCHPHMPKDFGQCKPIYKLCAMPSPIGKKTNKEVKG